MATEKTGVLEGPDMHIQDQKHSINQELIGIIKFRQAKRTCVVPFCFYF